MENERILFFGLLLSLLLHVNGLDVCSYIPYTYCNDGYHCCDNDTRCCSDLTITIGAIIGIVIGGIIFVSCVIAVICVVTKKNHRPGQVIHPTQQTGVAVIATGSQYPQQMHGQPMHGQPMYGQPQYGQPQYGQPMGGVKTGSGDPAYPPPPPPAY